MGLSIGDKQIKGAFIGDKQVKAIYIGDKKIFPIQNFIDSLFGGGGIVRANGVLKLGMNYDNYNASLLNKSYRKTHIEAVFGREKIGTETASISLDQGSSGTSAPLSLEFKMTRNAITVFCGYYGNEIHIDNVPGTGELKASVDVKYNVNYISEVILTVRYNGKDYKKTYGSHSGNYLVGLPNGRLRLAFLVIRGDSYKTYVKNILAY